MKDATTALKAGRGTANHIENTTCLVLLLADVKSSIKVTKEKLISPKGSNKYMQNPYLSREIY